MATLRGGHWRLRACIFAAHRVMSCLPVDMDIPYHALALYNVLVDQIRMQVNVLVQWHGFQPHASGFVPLSMAEFSL
jgi:hypothetical protein